MRILVIIFVLKPAVFFSSSPSVPPMLVGDGVDIYSAALQEVRFPDGFGILTPTATIEDHFREVKSYTAPHLIDKIMEGYTTVAQMEKAEKEIEEELKAAQACAKVVYQAEELGEEGARVRDGAFAQALQHISNAASRGHTGAIFRLNCFFTQKKETYRALLYSLGDYNRFSFEKRKKELARKERAEKRRLLRKGAAQKPAAYSYDKPPAELEEKPLAPMVTYTTEDIDGKGADDLPH